MKKSIHSIGVSFLLFVGLFLFSCSNGASSNNTNSSEPHGKNAPYTSAYICPMHCKDSGSDKEGTCPVCGMDYVKQSEHTMDGHKH